MSSNNKEVKPQSRLQRAHSQTMWAVHFLLHLFPVSALKDCEPSLGTQVAMYRYNKAVTALKKHILQDYKIQRKRAELGAVKNFSNLSNKPLDP